MHISFGEILLVFIIALLVINPQQLPVAAHTLGKWIKWFREMNEKIKRDMEKPLDLFSHENSQVKLYESKKQIEETEA